MKHFLGALMILFALVSCSKDEVEIKSNLCSLTAFSVKELTVEFTKTSETSWFAQGKPTDNIVALTAVFEVSPKSQVYIGNALQTSGVSVNNFSSSVTYTVKAEDGTSADYVITISKGAAIIAYAIKELPNATFTITTDSIITTVDNGTDLTSLTAQFSITQEGVLIINGVEQLSGVTKNNFQTPIAAKLKQTDGFESTVIIAIKETPNQKPVAHAGTDSTYFLLGGASSIDVKLDGSLSSDFEKPLASYVWKDGAGDVIATGAKTNVVLLAAANSSASQIITLEVTDSRGETAIDKVEIMVQTPGVLSTADAGAEAITKALYKNLGLVANSGNFIFGQEFPLSFQLGSLRKDLATSDCKDVTGDHPGVYGIDPHFMLYRDATERQLHIDEAKHAYQNGSVVTMEFHHKSRFDQQIYYDQITNDKDKSLVYDIVNNLNGSRTWFYKDLDKIISIVNNDLGFPIVYRPFHEMDGGWFWWGDKTKNHTPELYKELFKLTVSYIKERSNLFLFAWSSNNRPNADYYPGDSFVDIVGFDMYYGYDVMSQNLIELSEFATAHNKVAALTEVGYPNSATDSYAFNSKNYWNDVVLKAVVDGGSQIRIAYALTWYNATWEPTTAQNKLYIPNSSSSLELKDNFKLFKDAEKTLFQEDVKLLNLYQ